MHLSTKYFCVSSAFGFARTMMRTNDASVFRDYRENDKRQILVTERVLASCGAALVGIYLFPVYMATDMCACEKAIRGFGQEEIKKPRCYRNMADAIFDFEY